LKKRHGDEGLLRAPAKCRYATRMKFALSRERDATRSRVRRDDIERDSVAARREIQADAIYPDAVSEKWLFCAMQRWRED